MTAGAPRARVAIVREPFIGSEAIAAGALTKSELATGYRRLFPDVYVGRNAEVTARSRVEAGWLWTGRCGVLAGYSAAVLHGSRWIDDGQAVELLHGNRRSPPGIHVHRDRIDEDEIQLIDGMYVTSPVRTALDLGCWYATTRAVAAIDALARATDIKAVDVEILSRRYSGRRGIVRARRAVELLDAGAQSPKESWLRVLIVQAGLSRPQTQIPVSDEYGQEFAYLDMGWPDLKVAVEYDGEQHRTDYGQYKWDSRRREMLERLGWIVIRVLAGDKPAEIISRVRSALNRRMCG